MRLFATRHGWAPLLQSCPSPHEIPDSPTGGRAPPGQNKQKPCAGSRLLAAVPGSPARAPSTGPAPRSSYRPEAPRRARADAATSAGFPRCSRFWPRSSRSPSTARRARLGARAPSGRLAPSPQASSSSLSSWFPWLHPLRSWSLRETRRGSATLDCVVEAEHHGTVQRESLDQQPQQQPGGQPWAPRRSVQHPVVVHEVPLTPQPADPQQAGYRARPRSENGANQQHLGMAPAPMVKQRCEVQDDRGEAGWQDWQGGVSWRGHARYKGQKGYPLADGAPINGGEKSRRVIEQKGKIKAPRA